MRKLVWGLGIIAILVAGWVSFHRTENNAERHSQSVSTTESSGAPLFYDGKGFFSYKQPLDEEKLPDGKLKVVYFFDYNCAACVTADDYLKQYAKYNPEKIELVRYPYFKDGKILVAKMHAALEMLGRPDLSDLYLFDSVGKKDDESLLKSDEAVTQWFRNHDVDIAEINRIWHSDELKKRVEEYADMYRKYKPITAPFVSINGKQVLIQSTLYNDDYTYGVLDHLYENRNNPAVLGYRPPKKDETSNNGLKETK